MKRLSVLPLGMTRSMQARLTKRAQEHSDIWTGTMTGIGVAGGGLS